MRSAPRNARSSATRKPPFPTLMESQPFHIARERRPVSGKFGGKGVAHTAAWRAGQLRGHDRRILPTVEASGLTSASSVLSSAHADVGWVLCACVQVFGRRDDEAIDG